MIVFVLYFLNKFIYVVNFSTTIIGA